MTPAGWFTFPWLVSLFSNQRLRLLSSFEFRSSLKITLTVCSYSKSNHQSITKRSSLRSLVQTRWQKNKIITLYRQSNQGGLTKLSTILNLRSTISTLCTWLYRYHSGRVHNYVSSAPRKQRHLPGKRGSQIGLPPSPHAFHP